MNTSTLLDLLSHTALKGAAVLLVALLAGVALYRTAAARRYALWITAMATLAVLPLAMWALPAWRVLPPTDAALEWPVMEPPVVIEAAAPALPPEEDGPALPAAKPALPVPATAAARTSFSWNMTWQDVVGVLPAVWISIATLLLLRLAWSAWCLRRLERVLKSGCCDALAGIAQEIGLSRVPRLCVGDANAVPMVWGVWRPRLLLPAGFEQWSAAKLRGVLLHELAHLKRRDPLALWTAQWVKALHWFNPLVWLTLRQLRADQERACDDAVLRHGVRASDYAQSLLDLSRHTRLAPGLSLCALTITRCAPVEARVKAILDPQRRREGLTLRWLAGLAGGALLITLPVAMLHAIEGPTLRGRILDRNGVVLAESTKEKVRVYPFKTLAAHVIGYTGRMSRDDDTSSGREALELQQDAALRQGKDVSLSLDMRVQALTTRAMTEGGIARGAAVVLDPRTGEILAAVSLPAYDANHFVPSISAADFESYARDKDLPLFNRCFRGLYPPASTFTPLTAMAGFSTGLRNEQYKCTGSVTYGTRVLQCWKGVRDETGHGTLDLKGAVLGSCNCYWYQFGNATRLGAFEKLFDALGFHQSYDLVSHESTAILPREAQLKKGSPSQGQVNMANLAIGHGLVLLSPVHLGILAATVANGGKVPQPSLIKRQATVPWHVDLADQGVTADSMDLLRQGMRAVVNDPAGTGKSAKSDKVVIAAKTGTAQWKLSSDQKLGLMIGFAPYDQPQIAFAVIYEGRPGEAVSGGALCGPVIKRIVEETLALAADGSGEVKPVEEKAATAQTKFDFEAVETSRQIKLLAGELKIYMKEFKMGNGQVAILGEASGLIQALQLRDRLAELGRIGRHLRIEWSFPLLRTLEDGRVEFQATGIYRSVYKTVALENAPPNQEAATPPKSADQAQLRKQDDAEIHMKRELADQWRALKKTGLLAELPAGVWMFDLGKNEERRVKSAPEFHFSTTREAGHRWLLSSLNSSKNTDDSSLKWPDPPEAFHRTYAAAGHCTITVHSSDSKHLHIIVSQQKPTILIAPDYSPVPEVAPQTQRPPIPATDADLIMDPQRASQWKLLKRKGFLADLPAEAVLPAKPGSPESAGGIFRFTAPREAAQRWLSESLGETLRKHYEKQQPWPEKPGTFDYTYEGLGDCMMQLACLNADRVEVRVWRKQPKRILIAPDESQKPRPAGKLAPEYWQDGLTTAEPALPTLDATLRTLRSTISPDEEKQVPWLVYAAPIELDHLPSDAMKEEEALLRDSRTARNRAQQALLVRPPLMQ